MLMLKKVVLLLLLIPAFAVQAEEMPAPSVFAVTTYTVNPGTAPMFEQLVLRYKAAAEKLGGRPGWFAYSPGIGNDLQYDFAAPVASFGMFADMSDDVVTAFGMEEAQKMAALARESIANVESYVVALRPDLGIAAPERDTPAEMTFAYSIIVKPGRNADWEASMANVIEASKKVTPDVYWSTFQGGIAATNLYAIRVNLDWTDMDTPAMSVQDRLIAAFGERKGKQMWDENSDMVESIETSVSRLRLDLSNVPAS
ncbi:MAG: hypothetical protein ACI82A_002638 [Candidatus Azotimanducaceae bacterium]|jgi:hypothetical protein